MLREDFEKVYPKVFAKAVAVAGEDAVQEAALYFMERLDDYNVITASLFIEMAVKRAQHALPAGETKNVKNKQQREFPAGGSADLEEVERENFRYRTGVDTGRQTPSRGGADDQANRMK